MNKDIAEKMASEMSPLQFDILKQACKIADKYGVDRKEFAVQTVKATLAAIKIMSVCGTLDEIDVSDRGDNDEQR